MPFDTRTVLSSLRLLSSSQEPSVSSLQPASRGASQMAVFQPTLAWFPEHKGLVAGLLGFGQGLGSTVWNALSPALSRALPASRIMLYYGAAILVCWGCGVLMTWPDSASPLQRRARTSSAKSNRQCDEALALLWLLCCAGMSSGFGTFSIFQARSRHTASTRSDRRWLLLPALDS